MLLSSSGYFSNCKVVQHFFRPRLLFHHPPLYLMVYFLIVFSFNDVLMKINETNEKMKMKRSKLEEEEEEKNNDITICKTFHFLSQRVFRVGSKNFQGWGAQTLFKKKSGGA